MKIRNSHYKPLIKLGLPIMVGQLGVILLSFADTMMVGRYTTEALAAAAFVNNMFNLVIVFATGFSYGLTPVVGSMFGSSSEGGKGNIGAVLKNAFAVNSVAAAVLSVIMELRRYGRFEGYKASWKKAIVTLTADSKTIEFFDGMM